MRHCPRDSFDLYVSDSFCGRNSDLSSDVLGIMDNGESCNTHSPKKRTSRGKLLQLPSDASTPSPGSSDEMRNAHAPKKPTSRGKSSKRKESPANFYIMDEQTTPRREQRVYSTSPSRSLFDGDLNSVSAHHDGSTNLLEYEPIGQTGDGYVADTSISDTSVANSTIQSVISYMYEDEATLSEDDWCCPCCSSERRESKNRGFVAATSAVLCALDSEIEGSINDAITAVDQVLNAFTLKEKDIQSVTSRIDKACKQFTTEDKIRVMFGFV